MRRLATVVAGPLLALALLAGPLPAFAQDAALADPTVGATVPFVGDDGREAARITVAEVVDPFEGYDDAYAPERGSRYVQVLVAIENTSPRPMSIDPSAFAVQDADGFLAFPASIALLPEAEEATPSLQYGELEAGGAVAGSAVFQVFSGVDPVRVVYQPSRERLVILADLRAASGTSGSAEPVAPAEPAAPAFPDLQGAAAPAPTAPAAAAAADPAATFAVVLVANNCPPGTPLPDIQVTPCPPVTAGFEATLAGSDGAFSTADLAVRGGRQAWTGVPVGEYLLSFEALPDGHDAYYVFGDGAEPAARVLGETGVPVIVGPESGAAGPLEIQVFFVDSQ